MLGGEDAAIAHTIWENRPLGIPTTGGVVVAVRCGQGNTHEVRFTRPEFVPLCIDVELFVKRALSDLP